MIEYRLSKLAKKDLEDIWNYTKIGPGATVPLQDIGSFTSSTYWSSTEFGSNAAVGRTFSNGSQSYQGKNNSNDVRPIRAF